ncbi:MAG TPA: FAD-dependent monooxygenase, partial [Casimicrobiaceae bacterium]|nr:FAD-dependent monooxygenase [Casimicrobiaceae bacterium]
MPTIVIVGGGICGLTLALALNQRGIDCRVYERAPAVSELGVGITLLPHGMREFAALGLDDILLRAGIENAQSCFFNRFGQLIYSEPRGKAAGYDVPEVGIHRGRLQAILYRAVVERLGADSVVANHTCVGVDQDERRATARFIETTSGRALDPIDGAVVIGCDGIHSAIR